MSLNPNTKYPGRITPPDADYTYGSSKDETAPGNNDGTPYEKARANDVFGLQQALLRAASIVPSGNADTQLVSEYLQAIIEIASGRAYNHTGAGAANTYTLTVNTNQQAPQSYFDRLVVEFEVTAVNTGATTLNGWTIGAKNVFFNGAALVGGEMPANEPLRCIFDLANDRWNLENVNALASGFIKSTNVPFIVDDGVHATTLNVVSLIGTVFESIGPTGSGATNVWTAMDNIPSNAVGVRVRLRGLISGDNNTTAYSMKVYARKTGSAIAAAVNTQILEAGFTNTSGSTESDVAIVEVDVPLDDTLSFDLQLNTVIAGTSFRAAELSLVGFF